MKWLYSNNDLKDISKIKGNHTELISLYIPFYKNIDNIIKYLKQELNQSSNIKDKNNRKNVKENILTIILWLKNQTIPFNNGIVIFSGKNNLMCYIPKYKIHSFIYRCGSTFYINPIYTIEKKQNNIGVIVIENGKCTISIVTGHIIEIKHIIKGIIPKKHRQGGQSSVRFDRLRNEAINVFYKKCSQYINKIFLTNNITLILIGGVGITKDRFLNNNNIDYRLKNKIKNSVNVSYNGIQGIKEVLKKSESIIKNTEYVKFKTIYHSFFNNIIKNNNKSIYGKKEIIKYLQNGMLSSILITDKLIDNNIRNLCKKFNTQIFEFNTKDDNGYTLYNTFGGFAAIKRY